MEQRSWDLHLAELLDLDQPIEADERSLRLYALLHAGLTPHIKRGTTIDGLKDMLAAARCRLTCSRGTHRRCCSLPRARHRRKCAPGKRPFGLLRSP